METAILHATMESGRTHNGLSSSDEWSSDEECSLSHRDVRSNSNISNNSKKSGSKKPGKIMRLLQGDSFRKEDGGDEQTEAGAAAAVVDDGGGGGGGEDIDESEKERMLALLRQFSSPVYPTSISSTRIESLASLPVGCMDSRGVSRVSSRIHSCANSNSNIHSCLNSSQALNAAGMGRLPSQLYLSSCASFPIGGNMTPLPGRKWSKPASECGTDLLNLCRICQLPGDGESNYGSRAAAIAGGDLLFSPCRCSGSLKYVHYSCLLKWIEISTRRTKRPPMCELCHFMYIRHKRFNFKFHNWRLPRVSRRDKCLHTIFFLTLIFMVTSAVATVLCFLSDNGQISKTKSQLSLEEVVTLICGVLFFVSFFLAMTVEIKARHTVVRLFCKFRNYNTEWQIEPYDKAKDPNCPKPYLYV